MAVIITSVITGLVSILVAQFMVERNNEIPKHFKDLIVLSSAVTAMLVVLSVVIATDVVLYLG